MSRLLLVGLGGAAGSIARHLLAAALNARSAGRLPLGTLLVNVLGCAAIGALLELGLAHERFTPLRLLLVTGVLGGFTTYSAFNQETLELARSGSVPRAALYVFATLFLGLAAGFAGSVAGRALATR